MGMMIVRVFYPLMRLFLHQASVVVEDDDCAAVESTCPGRLSIASTGLSFFGNCLALEAEAERTMWEVFAGVDVTTDRQPGHCGD